VAEVAFEAWNACNVGVDLETVEDELDWMELCEAMGILGVILRNHSNRRTRQA
jgi:hypothetical protein